MVQKYKKISNEQYKTKITYVNLRPMVQTVIIINILYNLLPVRYIVLIKLLICLKIYYLITFV